MVPVPVVALLLVVPDAVPPVVRLGTPDDNVGTGGDSEGIPLDSVGTDGTLGPVEREVPAVLVEGGVTTVVTPVVVVGGTTVVPRTAAEPVPVVVVVVVVVGVVVVGVVGVADEDVPAALGTIRGAPVSGSTQFTSRFEQ